MKHYWALKFAPAKLALVSMALFTTSIAAQIDEADANTAETTVMGEIFVTGGRDELFYLPGSATIIDDSQIGQFDITDFNSLLKQAPGVYIRQEDGYGLRPNIGIRGVTSDRSQKITLMEDGILITPSPYSAPAAYYIPNVNRMSAIEVYKGPASINYGPNTVGGAINLVTPAVPDTSEGQVAVTYGSDNFQKYRAFYGTRFDHFGFWVDALNYQADGFKELDSGGDTGFDRNDINTKLSWYSDATADIYQQLTIKLGYADETADETYLGLTDEDFAANPDRRYIASQLDEFESEHWQVHALYQVDINDWGINTRAYYQRFDRVWRRFAGFLSGPSAQEVLARPDIFVTEIGLLRGEIDSNTTDAQTLGLTNNDREYGSQGIEFDVNRELTHGQFTHQLRTGIRYHHDYVERDHTTDSFRVVDGQLVTDNIDRGNTVLNRAESDAVALFVNDTIEYADWRVNLGLRYETIQGDFDDQLTGVSRNPDQDILLPGIGLFYQLTDRVGLLAGVYRGFSPSGPSATDNVEPEEAVNYEYGLRYRSDAMNLAAIGFFSDYRNLLGRCRASDVGCEVGDEFNGGEVQVSGFELTADYISNLTPQWTLPISLVYTYTESAFQSSFQSGFSQWGFVDQGDELPYLPEHQGRLQIGLTNGFLGLNAAVNYTGRMRETPGRGDYITGDFTPELTTLDLAVNYFVTPALEVKVIGENVTDEQEVVSRRPLGARPNQPNIVKVGVVYNF